MSLDWVEMELVGHAKGTANFAFGDIYGTDKLFSISVESAYGDDKRVDALQKHIGQHREAHTMIALLEPRQQKFSPEEETHP